MVEIFINWITLDDSAAVSYSIIIYFWIRIYTVQPVSVKVLQIDLNMLLFSILSNVSNLLPFNYNVSFILVYLTVSPSHLPVFIISEQTWSTEMIRRSVHLLVLIGKSMTESNILYLIMTCSLIRSHFLLSFFELILTHIYAYLR